MATDQVKAFDRQTVRELDELIPTLEGEDREEAQRDRDEIAAMLK